MRGKLIRSSIVLIMSMLLIQCASIERRNKVANIQACTDPVIIKSVNGNFEDVWESLKFALNQRGLVISSVSHVGEMLDRTGKALGRTKKIYGHAMVMGFCSAVISRDMLEENPHLIAFCPYQIAVYTLPGQPNRVYLSYRKLIWKNNKHKKVLKEVEKLLEGLVQDVIDEYGEYQQQ